MIHKITDGYVIQVYSDQGDFVSQEFIAGDRCDWENAESGECIDCPEDQNGEPGSKFPYVPFHMSQSNVAAIPNIVTEAKK